MKKDTIKKKVYALGILTFFCLLIYSCWQDELDTKQLEKSIGSGNQELTITEAKKWHNTNCSPLVTIRSSDMKGIIATKPNWDKAKESNEKGIEVVETPLMTTGSLIFMDSTTNEKYLQGKDLDKIRNVVRMVVLKDLKTGGIYHFIMVFIGTYDYLMNTTTFEKNTYLHREPNFEGKVLFYSSSYGLVNGWKYESGKITGIISPSTEEEYRLNLQNSRGKSQCSEEIDWIEERYCWNDIYWDNEVGAAGITATCEKYSYPEYNVVCVPVDDDFNSGGGGYTPPTPNQDQKLTKKDIEQRINEKLRSNCGFAEILDKIGSLDNLAGVSTVPLENSSGGYNPNNKIMHLPEWDGDVMSSTFLEELIHFMQDQLYPNGTKNLVSTAKTNIEFEAKVIVDLYHYGKDGMMPSGGSIVLQRISKEKISLDEYKTFLFNIQKGNITNDEYKDMLNKFNEHTPYSEYKNKLDNNLIPILFNSYGKSFLSNKCK